MRNPHNKPNKIIYNERAVGLGPSLVVALIDLHYSDVYSSLLLLNGRML